jgi:hypothetical protein
MRTIGTVGEPRISSIRFYAQELQFNKHVQHLFACCTIDTVETLRLFQFQAQPKHFQILRADTVEKSVERHGDFSMANAVDGSARCLRDPWVDNRINVEPASGGYCPKDAHDGDHESRWPQQR